MEGRKVAIITGATRGIGKAIKARFGKEGWITVGTSHYQDVRDMEQCKMVADTTYKQYKRIDCLINNAGILQMNLLLAMTEEEFENVVNINLTGTWRMIKACYQYMLTSRGGNIINISSIAGIMSFPGMSGYCAAKAGVIGLTRSLAKEFAGFDRARICVNTIAPGFIETDMSREYLKQEKTLANIKCFVPWQKDGKPESVADWAYFLASKADYTTGNVIRVDGGLDIGDEG